MPAVASAGVRDLIAAVVCTALLLGGCATQSAPDGDTEAEAIREAREVLGNAVSELGAAVVATEDAVTAVRLGQPPAPTDRLAALEDVRTDTLTALDDALETTALDLPDEPAAVRDAQQAWEEARGAARDLLDTANSDLDHTERLVALDAELAEIVSSWETPGSHSQQVERFTSLRNRARSLANDLQGEEPRPACSRAIARRAEAAEWVATSTDELLTLIQSRRGEEFDARRQALTADPYGFEDVEGDPATLLGELDDRDRDCWEAEGATPHAREAFDGAIDRVERALNPS